MNMDIYGLSAILKKYTPAHFQDICNLLSSISDELQYTKAALSRKLIASQNQDDYSTAREILDAQEEILQWAAAIQKGLYRATQGGHDRNMKQKTRIFIAVLTALTILSGCGSASSSAHSDQKVAEDVIAQEAETEAVSEYFTNDQLENMKRALKIPEDLQVEVQIGEPYYWDGGDMDLVQVDFYHEGEYIAGAAFEPYKEDLVRNIYQYIGE